MSVVTEVGEIYTKLETGVTTLVHKAQALLDTTEVLSDEDGQLLVTLRDEMVALTGMVKEMTDKIEARLDS